MQTFDECLLQQVIERGMHSGEGIQGCSIYTGTGGVAYMFLRLAESLRHSQSLIAQHPKQPLKKLTPECLLKRAEEYGHWANHLSHRHTKVHIVVFCPCFPLGSCYFLAATSTCAAPAASDPASESKRVLNPQL